MSARRPKLTVPQHAALAHLVELGGWRSALEVARSTSVLAALEQRGLVESRDWRSWRATAKGREHAASYDELEVAGGRAELEERRELIAKMRRFNPFGGYCLEPCRHPGHSTEAYRKTVARIEGRS